MCLAIREAFQALDADSDGLISIDDVRTLIVLCNPDMNSSDTQKIVNEAGSYGKSHIRPVTLSALSPFVSRL